MAEPSAFSPVKLICGLIASSREVFDTGEEHLAKIYGKIDSQSPVFDFSATDYYEKEMGERLQRKFISFFQLIPPERLSQIKMETNSLEKKIQTLFKMKKRVLNLDPGYITTSSLIMATAKNFSHRIPLAYGIYAHLEFLFGRKNDIRSLEWTYPDFVEKNYHEYFKKVRKIYLVQLKREAP